jgi:hypothetical protein
MPRVSAIIILVAVLVHAEDVAHVAGASLLQALASTGAAVCKTAAVVGGLGKAAYDLSYWMPAVRRFMETIREARSEGMEETC